MKALRVTGIILALGLAWTACATETKTGGGNDGGAGGTTSSGTGGTTSSGTGGTTSSGTGGTTSSGTGGVGTGGVGTGGLGTGGLGTGGLGTGGLGTGGLGTGGAGGALPTCDGGDCDVCAASQCADAYCDAALQACVAEQECLDFDSCTTVCNGDGPCTGACEQAYPAGASLWYATINCFYCSACSQDCSATCPIDPVGPGTCDEGDCGTCGQGLCSEAVCDPALTACGGSQECLDFNACVGACPDDACVGACEANYPVGAPLWYAAINCLYCDAATCSQDCSASCPIDPVGPQTCDEGDCAACGSGNCAVAVCDASLNACINSQDCIDFDSCYVGCGDDACIAACEQSNQAGANLWYALVNCLYCGAGTCSQDCSAICPFAPQGTLTCDQGDCANCVNSQCTGDACDAHIQTCSNNPDCVELYNCFINCPNQGCENQCYSTYPNGEADFDAMMGCIFCDPATCAVDCAAECPW